MQLRPHQQRIVDRMVAYDKGQVIVPTGGGKTMCMITDTKNRLDSINTGYSTKQIACRLKSTLPMLFMHQAG